MFCVLSSYVVSFYVPISSRLSSENVKVHVTEICRNFDITEIQKELKWFQKRITCQTA